MNKTDKTDKKYAFANIKIPIEINKDGTFEALPEYMSIHFDTTDKAPTPSENDYNNLYIKKQILELLNNKCEGEGESESVENIPIVTYEELKNRIKRNHKKDITFKNKKSTFSKYTLKSYSSLKDKDAVRSESPMAQE